MTELPKDAEGKSIPLDTEELYTYDGEKQDVLSFAYYRKKDRWEIETDSLIINSTRLYLTKPDTTEQLIEDIKRAQDACNLNGNIVAACIYSGNITCSGCDFFVGTDTCISKMLGDIATRVERLCGDDE